MKVKVKICGIRTLEAAQTATLSGADFLGFNFVESSKRYINPSAAAKIIKSTKGKAQIVGVFQNADAEYVNKLSSTLELDIVQLHGQEDDQYIKKIKLPVIKVIGINDNPKRYRVNYFLIDRPNRKGPIVNLKKAAQLARNFQVFFAGGLNSGNVANVIKQVKPFALDVASGIETNGVTDNKKVKRFIKNVRESI